MSEQHSPNTPATDKRDQAQEEQLAAHARGDNAGELKGFIKEVLADHEQFPGDVKEDGHDPDRRVDEEQGTPVHPEVEPGRS